MNYLLEDQETERLKFRLVKATDFNAWMDLMRNDDAARFVGMGHLQDATERCKTWFDRVANRYSNQLGGMNVLEDKQTGQMIGQAGLLIQEVQGETFMEIGYSMLPQYWGKGYATEAAIRCRDYAFEHHFADALISIIHTENEGSKKVALNNGMRLFRTTEFKDMPVNIFRISKAEWLSKQASL